MAEAGRATTGRFARRSPVAPSTASPSAPAPVSTIDVSTLAAPEAAVPTAQPTAQMTEIVVSESNVLSNVLEDGAWAIQLEELGSLARALDQVSADMARNNPNLRPISFATKQRWHDVVKAAAAKIADVITVSAPGRKGRP